MKRGAKGDERRRIQSRSKETRRVFQNHMPIQASFQVGIYIYIYISHPSHPNSRTSCSALISLALPPHNSRNLPLIAIPARRISLPLSLCLHPHNQLRFDPRADVVVPARSVPVPNGEDSDGCYEDGDVVHLSNILRKYVRSSRRGKRGEKGKWKDNNVHSPL